MMRLAPLFAASALLFGCAVGPNFQTPDAPPGAEAPLFATGDPSAARDAPPDAWWRLYNDPRLDAYLAEAFAANADLKAAQANLSAARAVLEAARAATLPATGVDAGAVYGRDPATDEILEIVRAKPETIWIFDAVFDVSYEFDLFGRVRRSVEASRADAEAAAAARDILKITVAAETTRAYAQVCALGEQLAVAQRSLDLARQQSAIANSRRRAGAGTAFDVVRSEGLLAQAQAALPPLVGQRRSALLQLGALLGRTPVNAPKEAEACALAPRLNAAMPLGDGASLLKRRPDVRLAERRIAAATARVGVATADLYPRITLGGYYGGVASDTADLTRNAGLAWGVGPKISWSFPNQSGPRARIRQAKAGADAALAAFDSTVLQALKETEQALAAYSAELDRRQALADAQSRAHTAFSIAAAEFRAGAIPNLDLLTAQQTLTSADAAVAASDSALVQDQILLFKALGGGWRTTAAAAAVKGG